MRGSIAGRLWRHQAQGLLQSAACLLFKTTARSMFTSCVLLLWTCAGTFGALCQGEGLSSVVRVVRHPDSGSAACLRQHNMSYDAAAVAAVLQTVVTGERSVLQLARQLLRAACLLCHGCDARRSVWTDSDYNCGSFDKPRAVLLVHLQCVVVQVLCCMSSRQRAESKLLTMHVMLVLPSQPLMGCSMCCCSCRSGQSSKP